MAGSATKIIAVVLRLLQQLKNPRFWVPVIVFAVLYGIYFWGTIVYSDTLFGGPGDHTAGLIWLYDHYPNSPWWQSTLQTAYPWGDELWSPLFMVGQIGYILFWLCAKVAGGSVAGYNLFTFIGFVVSFATAYRFILTRFSIKPLISSLFALVITFTPMAFYLDGVGHSSYLFMPAYLIGTVWLALKVFEVRSWKYGFWLGIMLGATTLFDPYFVLFIPLAVGCFVASLLLGKYHKQRGVSFRELLKRFALVGGAALLVILPVMGYLKSQAGQVNQTTTSTRTSMMFDASIYSAKINDYLLPPAQNPLVPEEVKQLKENSFHGTDPTFTLYLGVVLLVASASAVCWWWLHAAPERYRQTRIIALSFLATAIIGFIFSLPPIIHIAGVTVHMPTWFLVTFTSAWRVFARFFFVVQPLLVLMVAAWFSEYSQRSFSDKGRKIKVSLAVVALLVLLLEYMPRSPFDASKFWTYKTNLPTTYQEVAQMPTSTVLAEYPIREQPYYRGSFYFAGQHIHNKTLFNAYSPISPQANIRMSLMDLSNPQTIPALRQLGVTTLMVWNNGYQERWKPAKNAGLTLISSESYKKQTLDLYTIKPSGETRRFVGVIDRVYRPDDKQIYDIEQPLVNGVQLEAADLCVDNLHPAGNCAEPVPSNAQFVAKLINESGDSQKITVKDAVGKEVMSVTVPKGTSELKFPVGIKKYTVEFNNAADSKLFLQDSEIQ
jgi:hypothetical protein